MRGFAIGILTLTCFTIFSALGIRAAILVVTVDGPSMQPSLKDGDRVLALRIWPGRCLRKGYIVLIAPWLKPGDSRKVSDVGLPFIKRVAGVAGDTIITSLADVAPKFQDKYRLEHDREGKRTWHIPPGHIFVLSDNLPGGYDSLSWGPVSYYTVIGVVIKKISDSRSKIDTVRPELGRESPDVAS